MSWSKILNYDYSKIFHWLITTGIVLFAALIMIVLGFIWLKYASKKYKCFYGYKTAYAKKDNTAWVFVNRTTGRLWVIIGICLFLADAFIMLRCMHGPDEHIAASALVLLLLEGFVMACCHFYIRHISKKKFGDL